MSGQTLYPALLESPGSPYGWPEYGCDWSLILVYGMSMKGGKRMKYFIYPAVILTVCFSMSLAAAQTKVVVVPLGSKKAAGDAVAADVLEGKTFSNKYEVGIDGAMVNNGAMTFHPGTADQSVPEGYHDGSGTVQGDADLLPGNIKSGASIFGVGGTSIEASGTATADQVLAGQTFSNASGAATGSMTNVGAQTITPGTGAQTITQGYHNGSGSVAGDADLVTGNIRSGANIFGVGGDNNVVDTGSGDATAGDLLSGKTAWVDGGEVSGAMPDNGAMTFTPGTTDQGVPAGYHNGSGTVKGDANLLAENICLGVTIFGVSGTKFCTDGTVTSAGQVWMDRNLGATRVATSMTDAEAYGDLYQWGRLADGHEKRTSPTTATLSATDVPGHGSFIVATSSPYDWRDPQNDNLWQGVAGVNNPCPAGFRLPTDVEFDTERLSWSTNDFNGAFTSPMKLVPAGVRDYDGTLLYAGSSGVYWSSTVDGSSSRLLDFYSSGAYIHSGYRAIGFSVRCLKD